MVKMSINGSWFIAGIREYCEVELKPAIAGQEIEGCGLNARPEI